MTVVTLLVAGIICLMRLFGMTHIAFQAVAHLFVGGLFGAWLMSKEKWMIATFLGMTALETACFFLGTIKLN